MIILIIGGKGTIGSKVSSHLSKKHEVIIAGRNSGDVTVTVGCIQKDDIPEILEKMTKAELVIFASPLYFWGVSAQLKTVIDRTYSLYVDYHQPEIHPCRAVL